MINVSKWIGALGGDSELPHHVEKDYLFELFDLQSLSREKSFQADNDANQVFKGHR